MNVLRIVTGITLFISLFLGQAAAEHEADHRYTIRGYVLDESEDPIPDVGVTVWLDDRPITKGRTDGQGYYSAQGHLHDSDIGRNLLVRAGDRTATIEMMATRGDRATKRLHYVNFVGANVIEGKLGGWRFPAWVYVAAAATVILVASAWMAQRFSRSVRRRRRAASVATSGEGRRPKKSRKSKRKKR